MLSKRLRVWGLVTTFIAMVLSGCQSSTPPEPRPELLIYCGITMIKPMKELAERFEQSHHVKVVLTQGGSQDLYDALKFSGQGDLYLPGSSQYRTKHLSEGLLLDKVLLGYNRVALVTQKNNPLGLTRDLKQLANPDYRVVLSSPKSGSIGRASVQLLAEQGLQQAAYDNATYLTTDSRRINEAFKKDEVDLSLNWYATASWPENKPYIDAFLLPEDLVPRKALELNLLSFSKYPDIAKAFMAYAASKEGRKVFQDYGFLTEAERLALQAQP